MESVERHPLEADASFDGGDLDCGNGLLLLIRQHIDPLERGQLLEFRSTESSVEEDRNTTGSRAWTRSSPGPIARSRSSTGGPDDYWSQPFSR
jgi:hypothetical protein